MANLKISELPELNEAPASDDILPIVDVGETLTTKKITIDNLLTSCQPLSDALTSIAGLTFVSPSFIKLVSNNTYVVRTLEETKADLDIDDLENITNYANSPMVVSGGEITVGSTAGTFTVSALTALLRTTNSPTGELTYVTLDEQADQSIPYADTIYFVCLNYNDGSPTISLSETNPYKADKRNIPIGKVMKDSNDNVHYLSGGFRFQDGVKKLHSRARELRNLELGSGSVIDYKADNYFTMTAGVVFGGINLYTLTSYDSSATTFIPVRSNGDSFIEDEPRNTIDYAHYDKGDGTLGTIGNNKYGVFWIYKHIDDEEVYVRYGMGSYSLAEAQVSQEPPKPDHLTEFGCLIGRIIVPYNGGSITQVDMVTDRFFVGTKVGDHEELGNLLGGTAGEHYHLTSEEYTRAQNALDEVVEDTTPQLGGDLDTNQHTIASKKHTYTGAGGGTTNIDWTKGHKAVFTFGDGNETLTFTAPLNTAGYEESLQLVIKQDTTGGRTITWPSNVKWSGSAPMLSTDANAIDIISFLYDTDDDVYYGVASLNFS